MSLEPISSFSNLNCSKYLLKKHYNNSISSLLGQSDKDFYNLTHQYSSHPKRLSSKGINEAKKLFSNSINIIKEMVQKA